MSNGKAKFREGSKAEKCYKIYMDNKSAELPDLLDMFVKQGKLTSIQSARTYLFNIKKKIK